LEVWHTALEVANGGVGSFGSVAEVYEGYSLARAASGTQYEWLNAKNKKDTVSEVDCGVLSGSAGTQAGGVGLLFLHTQGEIDSLPRRGSTQVACVERLRRTCRTSVGGRWAALTLGDRVIRALVLVLEESPHGTWRLVNNDLTADSTGGQANGAVGSPT
jgi:hypothetical protein